MEIKETENSGYGCVLAIILFVVLAALMKLLPKPYSLILYDITIILITWLPISHGIELIRDIVLKSKSRRWKQTTGLIIQSKIIEKDNPYGEYTCKYWCLEVEFEYSINGSTYNSSKFYAGSKNEYRNAVLEETQKLRSIYEQGKHVIVFYNQQYPGDGILRPGISLFKYVSQLFSGLGYIIIGLILLLIFFVFFDFDGRPFILFEYF